MFSSYYPIEDCAQAQIKALRQRGAQERLIASLSQPFYQKFKVWIAQRLDLRSEPRRAPAAQRL